MDLDDGEWFVEYVVDGSGSGSLWSFSELYLAVITMGQAVLEHAPGVSKGT